MAKPVETPFPDPGTLLPGATFGDCFSLTRQGHDLDAFETSQRVFGRTPGWIRGLLATRNVIARPFGLKAGSPSTQREGKQIGIFPVISRTPDRVVMGMDDKHLDFRVSVDITRRETGEQDVSVATAVKTHNWLGRTYLATIMPFHRIIVPAMLAQAAPKSV